MLLGISDDCPYIFAAPMGQTNADAILVPLWGNDFVRKMAEKTGAANITATKHRKHLAIIMQLVQLSENEMDIVAKFMGRDIRVHKNQIWNCLVKTRLMGLFYMASVFFLLYNWVSCGFNRSALDRDSKLMKINNATSFPHEEHNKIDRAPCIAISDTP